MGQGEVKKILILKPSSLGDIVHSLPVLPELKKLYPGAYIAWFVFEHFSGILAGNPYLDEVISWKKGDTGALPGIIRRIRRKKYDIVIDLQGLARTGIIAMLSGAKLRLGCPGLKELSFLLEKEIEEFNPKMHAVDRNMKVVEYLGGKPGERKFFLPAGKEDEIYAGRLLEEGGFESGRKILGVAPSAGIPQKMWPAENFAALCDRMAEETGCGVVFFGLKKEDWLVEKISSLMKNHPVSAAGRTNLGQLCALIKKCDVFLGNDTGTLHIAAALGVSTVGLYGPSNTDQLRPYGRDAIAVCKGLDCGPCGINPSCKTNECMKQITVEEVLSAVRKQMDK